MNKYLFDEKGIVYNEQGKRVGRWVGFVLLDDGNIFPMQFGAYVPTKLKS